MIQDKALEIITRGPITYDGLRAELGCTPGELDGAIRSLETALAITRDRGRLRVAGPNGLAHQVADAQALTGAALAYSLPPPAPETKRCSKCGEDKSIEHFNKHPATKDGFDTRCRECVSNAAKARRIAAGKGVAPSKAPPPQASSDSSIQRCRAPARRRHPGRSPGGIQRRRDADALLRRPHWCAVGRHPRLVARQQGAA